LAQLSHNSANFCKQFAHHPKKFLGEEEHNFRTILVDPPRSGLDEPTTALVKEYENILYVSCGPESLLRDLDSILLTHVIKDFAVFDLFPCTKHSEVCLFLVKKYK
jgi:tRNA (uracil-5-)-methyltransferase